MNIFHLSVATTFLALSTSDVNYCDPYFCVNSQGKKHIACNNDGSFAPNCPKNARLVDIKPVIPIILHEHNKRRNALAGGELLGYEEAARMATMQWDNELAQLATFNVKQCLAKLDDCRNTKRFRYSGQNIQQISYDGSEEAFSDEDIIQNGIVKWFAEYKLGTMDAMKKCPIDPNKINAFGHFALVVIEENNYVGCAALRFINERFNNVIVTCNYAKSLIADKPIYQEGPPASACTTGKNKEFPNLCSNDEVYGLPLTGL